MRSKAWRLAVSGCLGLGFLVEPTWHLGRNPGTGCWPPRCQEGQIPLATPVLGHGGRLVMIGDGAAPSSVYASDDGVTWRGGEHDASWGVRYQAADASFGGSLWRMGGFVERAGRRTLMNDVWRSDDGRRWDRVLEHAPWPPRSGAHLVAFRDTLWLLGGEPNDGRMWGTIDGRSWSRRTTDLPRTNPQGVLSDGGVLWIVGHGAWHTATNDVWKSSDGATWTRLTEHAPWSPRTGAGMAVFAGRLWVVGGSGHTDVWSSSDGVRWERAAGGLPGPPRTASFSVVFGGGYWVFGGKTGGEGGTGFWDGVWYLK